MRWIRAKYPLSVTKNNLDPFEYFFNSQKELEDGGLEETPLTDEGIQNVDDASILLESLQNSIDYEKHPSIKVSYEKISYEFISKIVDDQNYLNWIDDSQVQQKFLLNKYLKEKKDIPVLIFEDFNTTGIKGDWGQHDPVLSNGERNDYHIFFWYSGNPVEKGGTKGGGVGVGRLTFAFSSQVNTFFSFSVREDNSKFFIGLSCLGKSKKNPSFDGIARFGNPGKAQDGSDIVTPITDEETLKQIHKGFKLKRGFNEPGTSMCVILPSESLTGKTMTLNSINRYRYAFHKKRLKDMEVLNYKINKNEILNTINKLKPEEHKKYKEYFKFLDECEIINQEDNLKKIDFENNYNPSKIKKDHLKNENIEEISKEYNSEKILGFKIPVVLEKLVEDKQQKEIRSKKINTFYKVFLKKTKFGLGMDDVMRGTMPVSDLRVFENDDAFGLVLIEDKDALEFFKMAEPPNHRKFEKTKELVKSYSKYNNQILLLKSSLSSIKSIIEDTENKQSITATQGFFSWSGGEDEGQSSNKKGGEDTDKEISEWIFENPKAYKINKYAKDQMVGFQVSSLNFAKECSNRIEQIQKVLNNPKYKIDNNQKNRLEKQIDKLEGWSKGKNLEELYPATIFIKCAQDIEGESEDKIEKLHDKNLDFNFSNKFKSNFKEFKDGDINNVEFDNNNIKISISGSNFNYKFLFDSIINEHTGDAYDLAISSKISRKN